MARVTLFRHARGQTPGSMAFAATLGSNGHVVHTPDPFDALTFANGDAGAESRLLNHVRSPTPTR